VLTELTGKINDILENGTCSLTGTESVDALIKNLGKGEEEVKIFVAGQEELYRQKMVLATAIMTGVRNGAIESLEGEAVTPQAIGAGVSAGLEQQKLMADLQDGNTRLDKALRILKYIGGALLLGMGLYFGVLALTGLTNLMSAWLLSIVGVSTLTSVLTWIVTFVFFTLPLSESYSKGLFYIMGKAGDFYDWIVSKISGRTFPSENSFIDWLKFKVDSGEVLEQEAETEQTETDIVLA